MDEGDGDYVAAVSAPEGDQIQGRETEFLLKTENRSRLEAQEIRLPREGNYPKSSIQEFMDLLDGKGVDDNLNLADKSDYLYSSVLEGADDRVQELTLENYSAALASRNENELEEAMQNKLAHVNQLTVGQEVRSSNGHDVSKGKGQASSSQPDMEGSRSLAEGLAQQPYDYKQSAAAGQLSCRERDIFSQNTLPFWGVKTKMISKAGFSDYFVKSTLKGKGIVYRGQPSPASLVELGSQKEIMIATEPVNSFDAPVHLGLRSTLPSRSNVGEPRPASHVNFRSESEMNTAGPAMNSLDAPISMNPTPMPSCSTADPGSCGSDYGSGEDSLRAWLKSRHSKVHKVDSLTIFRKILDVVDSFHSNGNYLLDLRPSCFKLKPLNEVKYSGRLANHTDALTNILPEDTSSVPMPKRPREHATYSSVYAKQPKLDENVKPFRRMPWFQSRNQLKPTFVNEVGMEVGSGLSTYYSHEGSHSNVSKGDSYASSSHILKTAGHLSSEACSVEEKWYGSPEEYSGKGCITSSNIYSLGILLFELLSCFDFEKARSSAMSDLRHRILPPSFLSENPKEAGFCLWLLHPEPSLRPTTREVLQSEVVSGFQKLCEDDLSPSIQEDETESELLLYFLRPLKEEKKKDVSKLAEEIRCIEADINEAQTRRSLKHPLILPNSYQGSLDIRENVFLRRDELPNSVSGRNHSGLLSNISQLETAYFSVRSQIPLIEQDVEIRSDTDLLRNREHPSLLHRQERSQEQLDPVGAFFDGLCKYARYSKLEVCGTARTGEFTNSANVIFSLSFDRDEEYFAAAGVSKKVKIFDYQTLCDESIDIHYPVAEMSNESRLSCICWNSYIHNYLASTDYDGVVKLWDTSTGQEISKYVEHERRAWSVDFSRLDPTKFASGSDDCSVLLWSINERNSLCSIRNVANVCCVQFSAHSSHLLAFGSADYKIYCYDIRNANVPWCTLAGHEKAVSYVKFLDSETLVSASTDNTLKLWDLNKSSAVGLSTNACNLTFRGHSNEKNFVGLSVADGYIVCGSETNEVYTYYKSLPMPITSHKFGSIDPVTGKHTDNANGQFVSSVCWRSKSHNIVTANSTGCIKVLRMA